MKYLFLVLINVTIVMGILTAIFSQNEYLQEKSAIKKNQNKFKVMLPKKNPKEIHKASRSNTSKVNYEKPKISSMIDQNPQVLGKAFASNLGIGASTGSGGGSFNQEMAKENSSKNGPPEILSFSNPSYPEQARNKGIEGYVKVLIQISDLGKLIGFKVLESDPVGVFESSISESIQSWTFKPGLNNGKQISGQIVKKIKFKLDQL